MAVLHGNWRIQPHRCDFIIWGDAWCRTLPQDWQAATEVTAYPYALPPDTLWQQLTQQIHHLAPHQPPQTTDIIGLPTEITSTSIYPIYGETMAVDDNSNYSISLHPWQVTGFSLTPQETFQFLQSLPLNSLDPANSYFGSDLKFWSHIHRWSIDLLARGKFLPSLEPVSNQGFRAHWQPLLDSAIDQARLLQMAQKMPLACRMYQDNHINTIAVDIPYSPQELLQDFLGAMIDVQVRSVAEVAERTVVTNPAALEPHINTWLHHLSVETAPLSESLSEYEILENRLKTWVEPLQQSLSEQNLFRAGFKLNPPAAQSKEWKLDYCLQAIDNPDCIIDAQTVWNHPVEAFDYQGKTVRKPQETLLKGLGLAAKLYPALENSLEQACPQMCVLNPTQAYEFIKQIVWRFNENGLGAILPPGLADNQGFANRLGLSLSATASRSKKSMSLGLESLLNFKWQLSIGGQTLSKSEFEKLVAKESPLVEINGEWVELRASDIRAAKAFFESRKDKMTLTLEDALRLSTGDSQMIEKLPVVQFEAGGKLEDLLNTLTQNQALEPITTPANFKGELRPYQARGVSWLSFLEQWGLGACLADDMGLGKTIQLIAFLLYLKEQKSLERPILLVCPTSVLGNWEREVKRFSPSLKVKVHHGDKREKGKKLTQMAEKQDIIVTSYALSYRDEKDIKSVNWQGIVLDEAQNIKNPDAKQSKAIRNLEADFKIALTGTPVENRLSELWSIMEFLNPGYLGQKQFFQRRFAIPIEKYGDTDSLQTLRSLVQPFILRRLKTDKDIIQDLPEKQENAVFCALSTEQASLYQQFVDQSLAEIDSAEGIQRRGMILALLTKLKQLCNHPILLNGKASKTSSKKSLSVQHSGKLKRLNEMLEEVIDEGDRALIFTQFAEWGKLLQPYLEQQLNRKVLFLYGATRKNKREEMVDQFQHDPQGPPIFILSLKAGGVGLNLTRANHVFHFDRWWNPAVENQATDRVFRIGQTRNVQVHKFVCTGTLEEKIHDLIESKKALAEQVVGGGEDWLTQLDTDQLRNLLILDRSSIIDEDE
ncbi:MAG: DEAD/DEAH box helicase [Microcoleaceae cyanobacterium]